PQLPLEAAIAAAGGFRDVAAAQAGELAYWRLSGGDPAGEIRPLPLDAAEAALKARRGLEDLVRHFDRAETPYVAESESRLAPRHRPYAHLARIREWSEGSPGGES
ncbi:MAG: double-strand break repair protein AddB, partial [Alphaproteobacteria bacterium]